MKLIQNNKRNKTKFKLPYKMCHFFQNKKQILLIVSALHIEIYLIERFIRQQMLSSFSTSTSASRFRVLDRKSTRLNSSHVSISYAVFCLKNKIANTHL